jgi:hypothetical protein
VFNNLFLTVPPSSVNVTATASTPGESERFTFIRNPSNNRVHIRAYNGNYLQVRIAAVSSRTCTYTRITHILIRHFRIIGIYIEYTNINSEYPPLMEFEPFFGGNW